MSVGEVASNRKVSWVPQGRELFGNPFPAAVSLYDSGLLEPGGLFQGGTSAALADQVVLWDCENQRWDVYYFSTAFGEDIWRKAGGGPSGHVVLDAGRAFWLNNHLGEADSWPRDLP